MKLSCAFLTLCGLLSLSSHVAFAHSPQTVNRRLLQVERGVRRKSALLPRFAAQESQPDGVVDTSNTTGEFPEEWFTQPLDHFSKDSPAFKQRFWVNKRHYVPGNNGPVIVLDGGETSGEDRLPFLDAGIVDTLAQATGGIGVVLEHRYYGESIPVANLTTDSLRWLTNEQALEDSANFLANVKFGGIGEDLTAPNTPWIYYGGSYAGARAAHMRVLYPDLVYGSIASSGVTHASIKLWEYMDVIRTYANRTCSQHLQNFAPMIDTMLSQPVTSKAVKSLFGLSGLEHDYDFVSTIESTLGSWQTKNWDPAVGNTIFDDFCAQINRPFNSLEDAVNTTGVNTEDVLELKGCPGFDRALLNYAKYVRDNIVSTCPKNETVEQCFGSYDDSKYQVTTLDQTWRPWLFQVCTQWGYFFTAPPDKNYPRIVSRLHTLENESKICRQAFPPGQYFTVPTLPNITAVNALGSFDIAKDRLAIVDGESTFVHSHFRIPHTSCFPASKHCIFDAYTPGVRPCTHFLGTFAPFHPWVRSPELPPPLSTAFAGSRSPRPPSPVAPLTLFPTVDPWRPVTPHSQYYAHNRADTTSEPFKLLPNAVHHWDENGLKDHDQEPPETQKIHREEVEFVKAWLKDFKRGC